MARRDDLTGVPLLGRTIAPEGSGLVLAEWEAAGRTSDDVAWQAPRHVHHTDDEARYVLVMSATTQAMPAELHGGFSGDVAALFEKYGCSLLG